MSAIVLECIMKEKNYLLHVALVYAAFGKPVFPCCVKDKAPLIHGGFKAASTYPEQLRSWWKKWPDALIGLPTGKATGIFVLDVDLDPARGINGEQSLYALVAQYGDLPETKAIRTRRGGRHLYFKWEPGIGNSTGKCGSGLDIRGEGGYVIVPPSPGYTVIRDADPVKAPEWLIKFLVNPNPPRQAQSVLTANSDGAPYGKAALAGLIEQMRGAADGNWNDTLNAVSFRFGQLVAGGELPETVGKQLKQAARETGTAKPGDETKLQRTFRSGFESGLKNPDNAQQRQLNGNRPVSTAKAAIQLPNGESPAIEATVKTVRA